MAKRSTALPSGAGPKNGRLPRASLSSDARAAAADAATFEQAERRYYRRILVLLAALAVLIAIAASMTTRQAALATTATATMKPPSAAAAAPRCTDGVVGGEVAVVAQAPGGLDAPRDSRITVTFSCPVDRQAVERAFTVLPVTKGTFTWQGETLIFTPAEALSPQTTYRVTLFDGLRDARGFVNGRKVSWPFITRATP